MSRGSTSITDVWDLPKDSKTAAIPPAQQQVQQLQQPLPPQMQQQFMQPPRNLILPPTNYMYQPPQQQTIIPQQAMEPAVDVVAEVNHMLNQTEQYLLQQIAELHRASHGHFTKALAAREKLNLEDLPNPSKPYLIALIVLVSILILMVAGMSWKFWKQLKLINAGPHNELLNMAI